MSSKLVTVQDEFNKNKLLKREDVEAISNWMKKQPHLPKISDLKIIFFLHSCYYNLESTKICIEKFYTIRTKCPEIFTNRKWENIKEFYDFSLRCVLPNLTPEGCSVLFIKLLQDNPEKFNCLNEIKMVDMTIMLHFYTRGTSNGEILIIDTEGYSLKILLKINITLTQSYIYYLQEALHVRIKGIHILGSHPIVHKLITMIKPFLKKEIFEILHVHKNLESLEKFVPREILPKEYGGSSPNIQEMKQEHFELIQKYDDFFLKDDLEKTDESKRIGPQPNLYGLFGIEGSFKSLNID